MKEGGSLGEGGWLAWGVLEFVGEGKEEKSAGAAERAAKDCPNRTDEKVKHQSVSGRWKEPVWRN